MGAIGSAMIAGAVAVLGIYLTQFLAERYRRFHDGSAVAAGLLGELNAYRANYNAMQGSLGTWIAMAQNGRRESIKIRGVDDVEDLFFEQAVPKLGLLGADLVAEILYIYTSIRAARKMLVVLENQHADMADEEFVGRCQFVRGIFDDAWDRGLVLLPKLKDRANASFRFAQ